MGGHGPVKRDAAWVGREYGRDKWPPIREQIRTSIAGGERSLSRVLASVTREEWGWPDWRSYPAVSYGHPVRLPAAVAWNGLYAAAAEAVIALCRADTVAIIEFGCGWGRSLFEIWLRGGPRNIPYYALEYTQAGLDCVEMLAALEPNLTVHPQQFDFNAPDLSAIKKPLKHAVVFTVSSVHQVSSLDPQAYAELLNLADNLDCLHFEEIGWQINASRATKMQREYALENDYNSNLWNVLQALADARKITIVDVVADWFGMQPTFPMSFIHWRRLGDNAQTRAQAD